MLEEILPSYGLEARKNMVLEPSLSLLMAVQNAEQTLRSDVERWLEMLPELTRRFEVVVVDDGSTDHTSEIAADLVRQFPQVRYTRHERPRGRSAALATARDRATGAVQIQGDDIANHLELRQRWEAANRPVAAIQQTPPVLSGGLISRLSQWCEGLKLPASESSGSNPEIKPPTFRSHLFQLSRRS